MKYYLSQIKLNAYALDELNFTYLVKAKNKSAAHEKVDNFISNKYGPTSTWKFADYTWDIEILETIE